MTGELVTIAIDDLLEALSESGDPTEATAHERAERVLAAQQPAPARGLDRDAAVQAAEAGLADYRRRRRARYLDAHARAMADVHDTWIRQACTEIEAIVDAVLTLGPGQR